MKTQLTQKNASINRKIFDEVERRGLRATKTKLKQNNKKEQKPEKLMTNYYFNFSRFRQMN